MVNLIKRHNLKVDMKFNIIREQVIEELNKSKISINLCQGSIDRGVFEALSMDLPVLYLKDNICGKDIINDQTGILVDSSPDEIAKGIEELLENRSKYSPRKWVLANFGEKLANEKLKQAIKKYGFGSTDNVKYSPGELKGSCVGTYL